MGKCKGPTCKYYDAEGGNGYCEYLGYDVTPETECGCDKDDAIIHAMAEAEGKMDSAYNE